MQRAVGPLLDRCVLNAFSLVSKDDNAGVKAGVGGNDGNATEGGRKNGQEDEGTHDNCLRWRRAGTPQSWHAAGLWCVRKRMPDVRPTALSGSRACVIATTRQAIL